MLDRHILGGDCMLVFQTSKTNVLTLQRLREHAHCCFGVRFSFGEFEKQVGTLHALYMGTARLEFSGEFGVNHFLHHKIIWVFQMAGVGPVKESVHGHGVHIMVFWTLFIQKSVCPFSTLTLHFLGAALF